MKRPIKKLSAAAVAVIVICSITATTVLAVSLGWHEKLSEYLTPSQEQMELLEHAVGTPEVAVTENNVTVRVKQTLSDLRGVYVLYEIETADAVTADEIDWRFQSFYVATEEHPQGSGFGQMSNEVLDMTGSKVTVLFHLTQTDPLAPGRAFMDFCDLRYYRDGLLAEAIDGIWRLEWDFTYDDSINRTVALNQEMTAGDTRFTITRVVVSPMSICIFGEGDSKLFDLEGPVVQFRDGTEVSYENGPNSLISGTGTAPEEWMAFEMYHRFDHIIHPSEVESVTLGGETIPLS